MSWTLADLLEQFKLPRKEEVGAGCRQLRDTLRLVLLTECDRREHIKEVERDGACGRYEEDWKFS